MGVAYVLLRDSALRLFYVLSVLSGGTAVSGGGDVSVVAVFFCSFSAFFLFFSSSLCRFSY